jgi:uncharacterized protein YceK
LRLALPTFVAMRIVALTLMIGLLLAGCSAAADTTTTTTSPAETTTIPRATTSSVADTTITTAAVETTTTVAAVDITVTEGVVDGPDRIEVNMGEVVEVTVLADADDEVHVHGYDLTFPTVSGVPTLVTFTADAQGIFEVELEEAEIPLFELVVAP